MTTGAPAAPVRRTYAEIHRDGRAGAAVLRDHGLKVGDAVAILAAKPAEIAPAAQAIWLAGGSVTMLHQPTVRTNLDTYAHETASVLAVIGARMVVVGEPFLETARLFAAGGVQVVPVAELETGDPSSDLPEVPETANALLQLTSGSTSTPKAVQITHRNLWHNIEAMATGADITGGVDVMVSWLPLFHDMGMVGFMTLPMCRGVELVKVTPSDFLGHPLLWPELISQYRGTCTAAPNFAYALAARVLPRATGLDLSCLRFALNGAEPIDVKAVRAFLAAGAPFGLPSTAMVCAYGMAETTLGVSFQQWGTPMRTDLVLAEALESEHRAVSASPDAGAGEDAVREFPILGPPLAGMEVAVMSGDGSVLGEREVGVLHVRGDSVTELYLTVDGPRPTRRADGWLDTGDIGYLVDGQIVVCGRAKDVIIMGGRNIYPTDIERVAEAVPGVRAGNAAAVRWTVGGRRESFAVAVESRLAGDTAEAAKIADAVRAAVTAAIGARPATVTVLPVGTLPKTPSGKIKRAATLELIQQTG